MSRCLMMCAYFQTHEKGGGGAEMWEITAGGVGNSRGPPPFRPGMYCFSASSPVVSEGVKKLKKLTISQCCFQASKLCMLRVSSYW